ncbi:MAG: DUF2572 family protein [Pasteurellaceae bacterium]|nr:DUF2572 family protein [Pasteurellaceae bacterium]
MIKLNKGIITISFLLIISSTLFMLMLFNQDLLRFHQGITAQRKRYVESTLKLQDLSRERLITGCIQNTRGENKPYLISEIALDIDSSLKQFFFCHPLFKKAPNKAYAEGKLDTFVNIDLIKYFENSFFHQVNQLETDNTPHFYWFNHSQTDCYLDGKSQALIIAEGDLMIHGQGEVRGAVVTGGRLTLGDGVKLIYSKKVATELTGRMQRWKTADKSWHDFEMEHQDE